MKKANHILISAATAIMLSGCGDNGQSAHVTANPPATKDDESSVTKPLSAYDGTVAKPGAPFSLSYKVVGTPIVGSPVTVNIRVNSTLGTQPILITYGINDASALRFHEAQPSQIELAPANNEDFVLQQVTVVPRREGRLYLNVAAAVETGDGSMASAMAIPIQVGSGGRSLEEQGEVQTDENDENDDETGVLPAD